MMLEAIPSCPTLTPSFEEFRHFEAYVQKIEQLYKPHYGMVKIVPPSKWKSRSKNYQAILDTLSISTAETQTLVGQPRKYYFECKNAPYEEISLEKYKQIAKAKDREVGDLKSTEEKEKLFWKNVANLQNELYCPNVSVTLMDASSGAWEFSKLKSVFSHTIDEEIPGLNTSYCFIGAWRTFFNWHIEDMDLSAMNLLHEGATKVWYGIHPEDRQFFEKIVGNLFKEKLAVCDNFLRHKENYIDPYKLKRDYPALRITKMYQNKNEISLAFSEGYHCGFNTGFNIAEAINYATSSWLPKINKFRGCKCKQDIGWELDKIKTYENLRKSEIYPQIQNDPSFKWIQEEAEKEMIIEKLQDEAFEQANSESIQRQVAKEKEKKINKNRSRIFVPKYGRVFTIEKYLQCRKCKLWRKVKLSDAQKFNQATFKCENITLKCKEMRKCDSKKNQ